MLPSCQHADAHGGPGPQRFLGTGASLWGPGRVGVTACVSHCWNWVAGEGLGPGLDHEAMEGMPYNQAAYLQKASI